MSEKRLILDAGSGAYPWSRATILCDLYVGSTVHRGGKPASLDGRPFICCDIQHLPFKTGVFFFVRSAHVLEHVDNPTLALRELKRVGRHGYVAFPSQFWELFLDSNLEVHQWVVDPSMQAHKFGQSGYVKVLKQLKRFFWETNWRIHFRERIFFWKYLRQLFHETIIRW